MSRPAKKYVQDILRPAAREVAKQEKFATSWIAKATKQELVDFMNQFKVEVPADGLTEDRIREIIREEVGQIFKLIGLKLNG